jgi:hypothetical protein
MRKTLIFGSLLAVFLILMLPAVSAEESKVLQSAQRSPYLLKAQETYMQTIRAKYANDPSPQTIFITLAILLLKLLRAGMIFIDLVILLIISKIIGGGQNNTTSLAC